MCIVSCVRAGLPVGGLPRSKKLVRSTTTGVKAIETSRLLLEKGGPRHSCGLPHDHFGLDSCLIWGASPQVAASTDPVIPYHALILIRRAGAGAWAEDDGSIHSLAN